jgi:UPF0755 protein
LIGEFYLHGKVDIKITPASKASGSDGGALNRPPSAGDVLFDTSKPGGPTSEQIVNRLLANDMFSGSIKDLPGEGTLMPGVYSFPSGTSRDQAIQEMQAAQTRISAEIWNNRNLDVPLRTREQLVTLASIVELETKRDDERDRVAAVYTNRLRQRIRLQSERTIIYGMVGGKGTLGRPINRSEIQIATPYNTFLLDGLPPGPICNPSRASLDAVARPARTRDLFFVADGHGGHIFSDTYNQHQKNVAQFQRNYPVAETDTIRAVDDSPAAPRR